MNQGPEENHAWAAEEVLEEVLVGIERYFGRFWAVTVR